MDPVGNARSRSLKPQVIHLSRHGRLHRSHVNQKHRLPRHQSGSHLTIHVTLRSQPSGSLSVANRSDAPMDLATTGHGHRQNNRNKALFFANLGKRSKAAVCPSSGTSISTYESATAELLGFSFQSNGNIGSPHHAPYDRNDLRVNPFKSTSSTEIISFDANENVQMGGLIGRYSTTSTTDMRRNVKRKNRSAVLRWNSTGITIGGITGQFGNGSALLYVPFRLALDWSYTLYVADWSNHRVQRFLKNSANGTTVAGQSAGSFNSTPNSLYYPGDVAVDDNGNIYVADTFNNRLQLWSAGSSTGVTVAGTGINGNASNQLSRPHAFARDPQTGTLYIADTMNNRVMRYLSGAPSGDLVAGGHGSGLNNTQLNSPFGLYFDSFSNSLVIANGYAKNIVRWTLGASSWTLLAGNMNGTSGTSSAELNLAMDVTLDPMGNMYVADRLNHRIQFFSKGDTHGATIAGVTGISGTSAINLNTPMSIALDEQLNLYVADAFNSRVQKFLRY